MLELVTHLRRDLIAAEFGERRSLSRRQADARAMVGQARRSLERTMQIGPAERREALRRLADAAVRP